MSNRLALFAAKEEIEEFFQLDSAKESIFEPHYNIAPAQHIAVIRITDGEPEIVRARWGLNENNGTSEGHVIELDEALEKIKKGICERCVIPASGYFKWKEKGKRKENPFFVRMLNEQVMALAAVSKTTSSDDGRDALSCALINTEANALVQPLDPHMPLQLDSRLANKWMDEDADPFEVAEEAKKLYLLTDMTVLRVSKKVNDLSENSPKLIQPLPK